MELKNIIVIGICYSALVTLNCYGYLSENIKNQYYECNIIDLFNILTFNEHLMDEMQQNALVVILNSLTYSPE